MTAELFEWVEFIVFENYSCEKYYYIYERICYN
jgi:hypothetical protein